MPDFFGIHAIHKRCLIDFEANPHTQIEQLLGIHNHSFTTIALCNTNHQKIVIFRGN